MVGFDEAILEQEVESLVRNLSSRLMGTGQQKNKGSRDGSEGKCVIYLSAVLHNSPGVQPQDDIGREITYPAQLLPSPQSHHRPAREALESALVATVAGCNRTKELESVFGRASYVSAEDEGSLKGVADPGALGLVALVKGILEGLSS